MGEESDGRDAVVRCKRAALASLARAAPPPIPLEEVLRMCRQVPSARAAFH
jgi:hypothetical protein